MSETQMTPLTAAIKSALAQPDPHVAPAVVVVGQAATGDPVWTVQVQMLAHVVHQRILSHDPAAPVPAATAPSPVEEAAAAKQARDIVGEINGLLDADRAYTGARWYPPRAGDIVHVHFERVGDLAASGETYLISAHSGPELEAGPPLLDMRRIAHGENTGDGEFAAEGSDDPLYDLWFEAGPQRITVVRDGRVVHAGPSGPVG
ncbi:hypothetical protein ABZ714_19610 [Streptomyces sp. NPDC006798]|uniref:hypothetical protein n=1 Tax=Streptomyces sp. NPDC006798 TaxID=3155462 RepID=UPI0033EADF6D